MEFTTNTLAELFSISVRQTQRLTLDGKITPKSDKRPYRYDETAIREYIAHLTAQVKDHEKSDTIEELERQKLAAEVEIKQMKAKAAQMELKELQGKMHRAEDVEAITTDHVLYFRSMLLAMPGKLAVDLAGTHTAPEQAERVKREVYFILNALADYRYDPDEYKKRVMERQGWDSDRTDDYDVNGL